MACAGVLPFLSLSPPTTASTTESKSKSRICKRTSLSCYYSVHSSFSSSSIVTPTNEQDDEEEEELVAVDGNGNGNGDGDHHNNNTTISHKFSYRRATPSVRWPHLKLADASHHPSHHTSTPYFTVSSPPSDSEGGEGAWDVGPVEDESESESSSVLNDESEGKLGTRRRVRVKKMNKLALKRAKDWRERVRLLTDRILALKQDQFVADVLDDRKVQMTPTDFCFVVKWVGQESWHRALEVYEWLNLRHWYSPNPRMLATMLAVLGKANQEAMAEELFTRTEPSVSNTVQVYNAMMGVYARTGRFNKVQGLLHLMRERGCEPDLVSFNTLINARSKAGIMMPNFATELLGEVRRSGLRPDIITYNTLISACSRDSNLEEAVKVFDDMEAHRCQPDLWTYNAMISVYGRCGLSGKAEQLFKELESKGFYPDAVTYNSLLFAFAREGNIHKVREICEEMVRMGFGKDEMTYNTIIHMYGKQGQHHQALQLYRNMKLLGRNPDAVTYTVLIDSLGKANMIAEASCVMSEMVEAGVKPTLKTYSALICGYSKAGKRVEAEETFDCMLRSGVRPDKLAYSVMLDIFLRSNEPRKAMMLYREMVRDRMKPDLAFYEMMLRVLGRENQVENITRVLQDMEELHSLNLQTISSILVRAECYDQAAKMLRLGIEQSSEIDHGNFLSVMSAYSSSGRHSEAFGLLEFLKEHASGSSQLIIEASIIVLCRAQKLNAALEEYNNARGCVLFTGSCIMYETLIQCCEQNGLIAEASQIFSDMWFFGIKPSESLYQSMVLLYAKMGFPETAYHLINLAAMRGILLQNVSVFVNVIDTYGKLQLWQKAESMVGYLRKRCTTLDRKVWNALIGAYAASGCYERARAIFNTMMRHGPSPTVESIHGLLHALVVEERLDELYLLIQELQDMGFKISKSSILLMLDAFAQAGNIFEVKKIYHGMKATGYFPTMHLYRTMIGLLCRGKRVRDVEAMVSEMEEAGFKPDLAIWNSMLKLYSEIDDFRKTADVYQQIKECGLQPDEDTYNTLIVMYCRDRRPEEGLSLMHEMRRVGLDPKLDTYKSIISAFGKHQLVEQAEFLFQELLSKGCKLNRSFYHTMMKIFRNSGKHSKAENLLNIMKERGVEPTAATMHLLMSSYGSCGHPQEAEKVLTNLRDTGLNLTTLHYGSVIDAYLRNGDFIVGIQKLKELKNEGLDPDHRIWTCFIRAASLCQKTNDAITLLNALKDSGFDLPVRLLNEKSELLVMEVDKCLEVLETMEDNAAFNFVNALEDLLWAFECRATALWVFQLAIKRSIYHHDVFRVADKDWGADFRKLSGGAALVGLTLWLDNMQDAALQGYPESPKSVVLITGTAEYNMVSVSSTLKACLWEMGSPFLPCKTRSGLLLAKAHSLRMWLKDSPFCLDLELRNAPTLPELNSMQLIEGCFIRCGLVPAFKEITEKLGLVRPKKFARLALLSDGKREKAIKAHIEGGKQKLEKMKKNRIELRSKRKLHHVRRRKFIRQAIRSEPKQSEYNRRSRYGNAV